MTTYGQAKLYAQVSVHESFDCSLAEAMLCECVPVVSRRAALPEVAGDCGFYADVLTLEVVAGKIREALDAEPTSAKRARQRIVQLFPLENRQVGLLEAIDEVEDLR